MTRPDVTDRPFQKRSSFFARSLVRRYAVLLWSVTLSVLLAASASEMVFGYRETRAEIAALQAALAEGAARELNLYLGTIARGVQDVAKLPWNHPDYGPSQRREEFYRLMTLEPAITALQAFDASGREQLFVSKRDSDRQASQRPIDEPELLQVSREIPLRYGATRYGEDLTPYMRLAVFDGAGATVATVDLRHLNSIVSRLRVGEEGQAYIVDGDDVLIAHPRATEMLRRLKLTEFAPVHHAREASSAAPAREIREAIDLRGAPVIATAAWVDGPGWLVVVEQPRGTALRPVLATLFRTVVLMVIGTAVALAAGLWFARRMAAPIVALRHATKRVAAGELTTLIELSGEDEILALARDFNRMTERLQESYSQLEAKVTERTAQLSEARDVLAARADQLTQLKDEAERANAAKTRFLAAASHDLRQPMHSISLLLGVLQSRLDSQEHLALADKIQSSVTTMENLFGNLLDISKLDAGTVQAHVEDVDLAWLLHGLEQIWAPQAAEKGLKLRVRPCNVAVKGDEALLGRIAGNLVANAIRYTREGGVLVACRRRGSTVELEVWDSGPGIEPRYREVIFEEFFRIEAPGTGQEKGLGLGLSIVQRCAHILGYRLSVESRVGKGSVFRVAMPLSDVAARAAKPSPRLATNQRAFEGRFIVVVDDEATNAQALVDALLPLHCHVVAAASCDAVLTELQQHLRVPDLIVTDFQLGAGRDGFEVIQRLRQHYDDAIPALIVTANTDASLQPRTQACGARLLHKPIGLQRLLEAMQESLASTAEP